ncbi:DUF1631 family protein [Piscinibacter sp.]|uniref:DUF1631 family protein n=1 Tax=Piscinibacter sp. TaxID=1903157 RepID=UPI002BC6161D|nr:DUF1631 family protein [Albitalea sp.]HUG22144.1 DUF1631 family protein [Albitalea sp.]
MNPTEPRLPTALEAALGHVKATTFAVAERVASGLGAQATSTTRIGERDLLLATQIDLRRKMNTFHMSFTKELTDKVQDEAAPRTGQRRKLAATDWQSLTLVEDHEVEERMFSERIGQQISHACEWELREMAAYMGTVLKIGRADEERNPFRADVLGMALFRAIEAVTGDSDGRKLLAREFGQAMASAMPACYAAIVSDLQQRNIQPVGLAVKTVDGPGHTANSGYASMRDDLPSSRTQPGSDFASGHGVSGMSATSRGGMPTQPSTYPTSGYSTGPTSSAGSGYASGSAGFGAPQGGGSGRMSAEADAQLMTLLRRLTFLASRPGALDITLPTQPGGVGGPSGGRAGIGLHGAIGALAADAGGAASNFTAEGLTGLMAVNLIRAHRDELMQASSGKLDHMVIDVVGSLFDQILSDPKVPPQMARQIARLQLPVLRVALVDSNFFSSRRHPVRRFVNRIASLACAFDDFDDGPGKSFLNRVKELVQEIVEGDFDQVELYSAKLSELESFISDQTEGAAKTSGAAAVLETKESELRVQQRYMLQLSSALGGIGMPEYLRDFVAQVWSQALVQAVRRHGVDSDLAKRFRLVGRDVVMSVQPKGSPVMRKRFLMQLPTLMKDLNEGMKLIGWPDAAQKAFFGQLLPSHAESLKAAPMTELEHNLLAKQLEGIFNSHIPGTHEFSQAEPVGLESKEIEQRFTPDEAQQVGLIEESAVDWSGEIDIDLSGELAQAGDTGSGDAGDAGDTMPSDLGIDINLDLVAADPAEPSHGPRLMDHIRVGFAYQMLLKDQWQKVRLNYVSPGRNFFVFTRGRKHQETISLTSRMLARMCESNRLRAVEHAYLMERATARARRQLAALKSTTKS